MNNFITFLSAFSLAVIPLSDCSAQDAGGKMGDGSAQNAMHVSTAAGIGKVIRDCAACPEMVAVPQVGHASSAPGKIFYAGRYEITWRQYLVAVREGACPVPLQDFTNEPYDIDDPKINDDYPMTGVGPDEFSCYLNWLQRKTGKVYRIPSAAEWEHIARAGTKTEYYWGDGLGYNNAVVFDYFNIEALRTSLGDTKRFSRDDPRFDVKWVSLFPVGQFKPNPWGLYDVIGNVSEITTEPYPPYPACVKNRPLKVCEMLGGRGADRIRSPNPSKPNPPITGSLTTTRYRAPAHGGVHGAGFRVVRD